MRVYIRMRFLDLKYGAFGLDVNDLSLKIVKLKKKRQGFVLESFNEAGIASGIIQDGVIKKEAVLSKIIKSACDTVKGKKLNTKYVIASLPEKKSFLQVIQMPKMTEEELNLAIPFEAENYIPLPVNDVYLGFQVIPAIKDYLNYLEVLIVATPKKIVDSYVSCFKKAGLVPLAFELESEAVARALVKKETNSSPLIIVDFGESNTNFVVFSGGFVRFTCSIPISSQLLTKSMSESLGIDFHEAEKLKIEYGLSNKKYSGSRRISGEKVSQIISPIIEDLVAQIRKYMDFYRDHSSYEYLLPDGKKEKILLCGGGSELKGLADFISKKLDIVVEPGDPSINLLAKKTKSVIKKDLTPLATAIGLALRDANSD